MRERIDSTKVQAHGGTRAMRELPQFDEKEIVALTFAIVAINRWNRLAVSFRRTPGDPRGARVPVPTAVPA